MLGVDKKNKEPIYFSCKLTARRNSNGVLKKYMTEMPSGWAKLTKTHIRDGYNGRCLITGEKTGIVVIDCDTNDGVCSYQSLIKDFPILNETYTVKTRNGYHIYTKYTSGLSNASNVFEKYKQISSGHWRRSI
jgi:hypothetical protein